MFALIVITKYLKTDSNIKMIVLCVSVTYKTGRVNKKTLAVSITESYRKNFKSKLR